jgi:hypothetical protein
MLVKDFKVVELGLVLNGLNSSIEGQVHMAPLGKFAKKFKMLQIHNENYENNLEFCKQKGTQCTQYLGSHHNPCGKDI